MEFLILEAGIQKKSITQESKFLKVLFEILIVDPEKYQKRRFGQNNNEGSDRGDNGKRLLIL